LESWRVFAWRVGEIYADWMELVRLEEEAAALSENSTYLPDENPTNLPDVAYCSIDGCRENMYVGKNII